MYRQFGGPEHQQNAIKELEEAACFWRLYTTSSEKRYLNPIWYNRVNMVDWAEITQWVNGDIDAAKNDSGPRVETNKSTT